jgi:hypothetical protein
MLEIVETNIEQVVGAKIARVQEGSIEWCGSKWGGRRARCK